MTQFDRYFGIDYSGAKSPTSSLSGLRIYSATPTTPPVEIPPPSSRRKYWTRRGLAEWLAAELRDGPPTLVGIDHAFSFPQPYFDKYQLSRDWSAFLDDFQQHWPTDVPGTWIRDILRSPRGTPAVRSGDSRWRRLTETRSGGAKSVFHFGAQGCVGHSTHAGLPWLRYLRQQLRSRVHFWPFDGWCPGAARSVIAEVYPRLWNKNYPSEGRTGDQHDAYSVARWMRKIDATEQLPSYFSPGLSPAERGLTRVEGWILGLP